MTTKLRPPVNRVAPRALIQWAVESLFGWALVSIVAAALTAWVDSAGWSWLPALLADHIWWFPAGVAVIAVADVFVEPLWRYRVHRWEVSADVVYTLTGWFMREWLLVPVSRIQTVDTEQGWIERTLGLATLKVSTASHAGSSKIEGLPLDVATRLAHELAGRAHELRDDAT